MSKLKNLLIVVVIGSFFLPFLITFFFKEQAFQFFSNNIIVVYIYMFLLFILFGTMSIYTGYKGLVEGKIELFWKRHYSSVDLKLPHNVLKPTIDSATGLYAKFWSIIYILWGIIMVGVAVSISLLFLLK